MVTIVSKPLEGRVTAASVATVQAGAGFGDTTVTPVNDVDVVPVYIRVAGPPDAATLICPLKGKPAVEATLSVAFPIRFEESAFKGTGQTLQCAAHGLTVTDPPVVDT